jgi:hypothetical protein
MTKGVFDQSIEDMLEFDRSLDINDMFDSLPALDTEVEKKEETTDDKEKKQDDPVLDINTVLEKEKVKQDEDVKKEEQVDSVAKVVEYKKDEIAPAPNEQATAETSSDAPFTVIFAKDLVQQGLISSFDEKDFIDKIKESGEATALRDLIKTEIDANIEAAKEDLDIGYKEFLNLIGKGVAADSASSLVDLKTQFDAIKVEDLEKEENVDLRKKVLEDYYKLTTSMTDAKITKLVQTSLDLGEDVEDSKEYLSILKTAVKEQIAAEEEEANKRAALRADENKRILDDLKDTINTIDEIILGLGINKQTKIKMYENLTKEVKDNKGRITNSLWAKRAEDPVFFDSRLAYLLETGFFEKGKTWNKASQAKTTKEISDLEKAIKKNTKTSTGTPIIQNMELDKTAKDNIESMRGIFGR